MEIGVGSEFEAFGILERELLIKFGLLPHHYLIDVGCGSGRLAKPLSEYLRGTYLGLDVVPEFLSYARELVGRDDWRFEIARDGKIPEEDGRADFVCFFSVLTHLSHARSYLYLKEARRVLKPSGRIVFSFLEFNIPCHWPVFEDQLKLVDVDHVLAQFLSRDAIRTWASHLKLEILALENGDKPHIPIPKKLVLDDGTVMEHMGNLGQSVCVLSKPE